MIYLVKKEKTVKTFYDLEKDKKIRIPCGKYILDVKNDILLFHKDFISIPLPTANLISFYYGLDVTFEKYADLRIPVKITKKGKIKRLDKNPGVSSIQTLYRS